MAFMVPEYLTRRAWHVDTRTEGNLPFFAVTPFDANGADDETLVAWFADLIGCEPEDICEVTRDDYPGIYVRLSAPGYMDCTEWSGPYATEAEAREYLTDSYDVDPDTGEDLPCAQ